MLSKEINKLFSQVAARSGIKAKLAMLEPSIDDPDLQEVLRFGMNPYITFGVGKATINDACSDVKGSGHANFSDETWELLEQLANRNLTGNAARHAILDELEQLNPESQDLLVGILEKDFSIGLKASSINKIKKDLIPQYKVSLAQKYADHSSKVTFPAAVELKLDGYRVLAEVSFGDDGTVAGVSFRSREGMAFENLDNLISEVTLLAENIAEHDPSFLSSGVLLDGEVTVEGCFKTTSSEMRKKDHTIEKPVYTVFWVQPLDMFVERKLYSKTYIENRQLMRQYFKGVRLTKVQLTDSYVVNSDTEVHAIYGNARAANLEGVMVKNLKDRYKYTRHTGWLKIKDKQTLDLTIVDFEEGEGKYTNALGAFYVDYNGTRVRVGSGLDDKTRQEVWDDPELFLDSIIEVSYQEITPAGSLRHPVFEGFRDDKSESDSTAEEESPVLEVNV